MRRKAQVVLETALVIVAMTIFLVGIMRVWAWFVNSYTGRWQRYNTSRTLSGKRSTYEPASHFVPDGYNKEDLKLFK